MSIQWYPGHMNKARRAIAESLSSKDVVLEVLDARMPAASANPVVTELRRDKPCIKILAKSDLADPEVTRAWIRYFEATPAAKVVAIALSKDRPGEARTRIAELSQQLAPNRIGPGKWIRGLVVGIPNVGKSTLINTLMERKVTKVADEPAVTKAEQLVTLKNGMAISDHPGILWPSIEREPTMRLALGGAIPDVALDYETVALFAAELFLSRYPEALKARFKLTELPDTPAALIQAIGRKRGCIRSGGVIDAHKASDILIHEFRTGTLGRISLEQPPVAAPPVELAPEERPEGYAD